MMQPLKLARIEDFIRHVLFSVSVSFLVRFLFRESGTFTVNKHTPLEGDSAGQLDVVAPGGAVQGGDALDGQAGGHVVALQTGAQVSGCPAQGIIALDAVVLDTGRGEGAAGRQEGHTGDGEHFHFDRLMRG